jgi:hypothetical protein
MRLKVRTATRVVKNAKTGDRDSPALKLFDIAVHPCHTTIRVTQQDVEAGEEEKKCA